MGMLRLRGGVVQINYIWTRKKKSYLHFINFFFKNITTNSLKY